MTIKLISKNKSTTDFIFPNSLWIILAVITVITILYHCVFIIDTPSRNKPVIQHRTITITNNESFKRDF